MSQLFRVDATSWQELELQWESQCSEYGEDFEDYNIASLPLLKEIATSTQRKSNGVFGYKKDGDWQAIARANSTLLPNYDGMVLRIRHIVVAPKYDLQLDSFADYRQLIVNLFVGCVNLAYGEMPSEHIKFHLKSPTEREFGQHFTNALKTSQKFTAIDIIGSWIYLSKTK